MEFHSLSVFNPCPSVAKFESLLLYSFSVVDGVDETTETAKIITKRS